MSIKDKRKYNLTRRTFIKGGLTVGALSLIRPAFGSQGEENSGIDKLWMDDPHGVGKESENYSSEEVIYSLCEQCNTYCTIKAVVTGTVVTASGSAIRKISGNPYSPLNTEPYGQIPYHTSPEDAAKGHGDVAKEGRSFRGGRTCLKGQAGIQTVYDQLRVKQPLKRVGPRGSGKFETISWEQAIKEITEGSDLGTPGLKEIWNYVPEDKVMADWEKVKAGSMTQGQFDELYKDSLIDTKHPDFGPKANQIVSLAGDRRDFILDRFWAKTLGSINAINHAGICGLNGVMANVYSFNSEKPKKRMYSDIDHAEFIIIWGTDPFVANKGPTWLAPKFQNAIKRGLKLAVIDPRMSKAAEKADLWVPILPGTDAALAFGMARWMIENNRFDVVVSGFLVRNVESVEQTLAEMVRVLKPGGQLLILDMTRPRSKVLAPFIRFYLNRVVSLLGAMITDQKEAYTYLPDSTQSFLKAEELANKMKAAGLHDVEFETLNFGTVAIHRDRKSVV